MKRNKSIFLRFCFLVAGIIWAAVFASANAVAKAQSFDFEITTNMPNLNVWATESITVELESAETGLSFFYSFDNPSNWQSFDNRLIVEQDGEYVIYFKATRSGEQLIKYINVKLDLTAPKIEEIWTESETSSSETTTLFIKVENDNQDGKAFFRAKLLDGEWQEPEAHYIALNQIVFAFEVFENRVFQIGDIEIADQAGNISYNLETFEVSGIDKFFPDFVYEKVSSFLLFGQKIVLTLKDQHSGIAYIKLTMPDGTVCELGTEKKQELILKQNGTYIFEIAANNGLVTYKDITVTTAKRGFNNPLNFVAFIFVLIFTPIALYNSINLTIKRKEQINKANK